MAGILDNPVVSLLLSGSPYMQNRWRQQEQQRVADQAGDLATRLWGDPNVPQGIRAPGMFDQGDFSNKQQQQIFGQGLLGIPGMHEQGTGVFNDMFRNQQRMNELQYMNENPSWYEKERLGLDKMKYRMDAARGNLERNIGVAGDLRDEYRNFIKETGLESVATKMQAVNTSLDRHKGFKGWTGAEDNALTTFYLKTVNPTEASTVDDVVRLASSFGFKGDVEEMFAYFTSGGDLDETKREQMYTVMNAIYDNGMARLSDYETGMQGAELDRLNMPLSRINFRRPVTTSSEYYNPQVQPRTRKRGRRTPKDRVLDMMQDLNLEELE